eukprot:scaffold112233_cov54-Phaeocystis_antarctica.AAC.1
MYNAPPCRRGVCLFPLYGNVTFYLHTHRPFAYNIFLAFLVNNARRRQCLHGQARRAGGALRGDGARTQPSTHRAPLPASPPAPPTRLPTDP